MTTSIGEPRTIGDYSNLGKAAKDVALLTNQSFEILA